MQFQNSNKIAGKKARNDKNVERIVVVNGERNARKGTFAEEEDALPPVETGNVAEVRSSTGGRTGVHPEERHH